MSDMITFSDDGTETLPLFEFTEKAYLDYSMYVILDRALPHVGDGLKPVQRRIIYAMSELGLRSTAKFKKSARTVGDVLGKYHPHGDSACYEAMVLMAQSFSYRYPLVDGQGNWGSEDDPKSFAAMRYTEARLTPIAQLLLDEIEQGTVDWVPNFDGTMREPALLPARLPMLLLNGATGIAVGMSTDIPPHNLTEVANACIHLLDNPDSKPRDLLKFIKGPDYPTGAEIITPKKDIRKIYETGNGSIKVRAQYNVEDGEVVVYALPHQTSGAKILEQIAGQMQAKKLQMVDDLRDESDHENPTRIVISPRNKEVNIEDLMNHLFATTDLEKNYRINLNVIRTDGKPKVCNILDVLSDWLGYRRETVRKRLQYRLDKVLKRLHILEGLHKAYLNIDEVIKIIRSEDEPKPVLMKRFKLSDEQAEAILELKLRHLAKLEEMKIKAEQKELKLEADDLEKTLKSARRMTTLIKNEITADMEKFGDKRRSKLVEREAAQALNVSELIASEPCTAVMSEKGWVRAGKGHEIDPRSLIYKSGDAYMSHVQCRTSDDIVFNDSAGRFYIQQAHTFPSVRGYGDPLFARLKTPSGVVMRGMTVGKDDDWFFVSSDAGYGFLVQYQDLITKNKSGKAVISVPKGCMALKPLKVTNIEEEWVAMGTNTGQLLIVPLAELPEMSKGKGIKILNIPGPKAASRKEYIQDIALLGMESALTLVSGNRSKTLDVEELEEYVDEVGKRGTKLPRGFGSFDYMLREDPEEDVEE